MEPTKEQLQRAAEWCGWKIVQTDNPDNPSIDFGDGSSASIDYPLTPAGRDAMEKAIIGQWMQIKEGITIEGAGVSVRRVGDHWTDAEADTPAAALVLAICQLAEQVNQKARH